MEVAIFRGALEFFSGLLGRRDRLHSTDRGAEWKTLKNLFVRHVDGIYYDAANKRVLVASTSGTVGFAASLPDYRVSYWDTGWALRFLRPVGDHLVGATLFDGMVVEPKMMASPLRQP